jgi:hypothetical protein
MAHAFTLNFLWIPPDLGGHKAGPWSGMRPQIRWQRYVAEYLKGARDVQCSILDFDPATSRGRAHCTFSSPDPVPADWLRDGELVELLSAHRVLAVGRIENPLAG